MARPIRVFTAYPFHLGICLLSLLVCAVLAVAAGSIFTTWSFFTNTVDLNELDEVRNENEELRQVNQSFEDSIRSLQQQLAEF